MAPTDADLDLSAGSPMLSDRIVDPEGYKMCKGVAIREGILAAGVAMSTVALGVIFTRRRATNWPTVRALLNYSPGVVFLVSSAGLSMASLFTELTLHDCTVQRGIFLTQYRESIGHNAIEETSDPNREKKVNWNVKRKYNLEDGR
jgi:hypothetical protein